jgi:2-alkyl-3-oxoalkanoate reductase
MKVLVAGGTGAVGTRLMPLPVQRGCEVVGTTRSPDPAEWLRGIGAEPVIVDGLDGDDVEAAVVPAEPEVVIHQMSGLTAVKDFKRFDAEFAATNRLRTESTDHLLAGAKAARWRSSSPRASATGTTSPRAAARRPNRTPWTATRRPTSASRWRRPGTWRSR